MHEVSDKKKISKKRSIFLSTFLKFEKFFKKCFSDHTKIYFWMTHTMKILFWKVGGHPEINFVWSEGTQNHDFWVPRPPKTGQKHVSGDPPPPSR